MAAHATGTVHEHQWHVVAVEYDEACPSAELTCSCGEVSFTSA
jgi:hypothetical protein